MKIGARVQNSTGQHLVTLTTSGTSHALEIPPKQSGMGSSVNGGELLFLALATCYCNDIHREATKRGIAVDQVEVEVQGDFGAEGEPARNVTYHARVAADAPESVIRELMLHTDTLAEIQNTLRVPTAVSLERVEAVSRSPSPRTGM